MVSLGTAAPLQRGRHRLDWTDWFSYGYLLGLLLMFGPVLWLVLSSFKTPAALAEFPPQLLPYGQKTVAVAGHDNPLPLYRVTLPDGTTREARRGAPHRHRGADGRSGGTEQEIQGQHPRPQAGARVCASRYRTTPSRSASSTSPHYLWNTVFVTVVATLITLVDQLDGGLRAVEVPLPRPQRGLPADHRDADDPARRSSWCRSILVVSELGLFNTLWGVILARRWRRRPASSCCASTC